MSNKIIDKPSDMNIVNRKIVATVKRFVGFKWSKLGMALWLMLCVGWTETAVAAPTCEEKCKSALQQCLGQAGRNSNNQSICLNRASQCNKTCPPSAPPKK